MSRIPELFEEIAESITGFGEELTRAGTAGRKYQDIENERLVEGLYKNDPLLLSTLTGLGTAPVAVPAWLSRFAAGPLNKAYGAVGDDISKLFIPPLSKVGRKFRNQDIPFSSGARVGQDARREGMSKLFIPPLTKTGQRTTNRGPRGNTNIDVPTQRQLPLENARNTGGVSDTERAMLEFMVPKNARHRAREVEKVIWNKDRFPKQSDRIAKRRPANAEEVNMIKAQEEGIMNTSPGKSYMEELGDLRVLEQQTNRKNILQNRVATKQAQQDAGELVDMKVFFKEQAELAELTKLLD